ncbi:hypothetical protein GQ600_25584 [Phytophthora cactorum]|nr:hypothetical protein GQ600_25584 [Phytophthora cactorum]
MKKAYEEITSKLGKSWVKVVLEVCAELSGYVVKCVIVDDSDTNFDTHTFDLSLSTLSASADPSVSEATFNPTKRAEALEMFRREVDL